MRGSTALPSLLGRLTALARARKLTDSAWAFRAGLPKETLSRLRRRSSCELATLSALAQAVDAELDVAPRRAAGSAMDGHVVAEIDRDYEERLVALCVSGSLDVEQWRSCGPLFFMAGLAVMLAGATRFDRRGLLGLAEQLHPGAAEPAVFQRWLDASPLRPSRFLPLIEQRLSHAA